MATGDEKKVRKFLKARVNGLGRGDGMGFAGYFESLVDTASINPHPERLKKDMKDKNQSLELCSAFQAFRRIHHSVGAKSAVGCRTRGN